MRFIVLLLILVCVYSQFLSIILNWNWLTIINILKNNCILSHFKSWVILISLILQLYLINTPSVLFNASVFRKGRMIFTVINFNLFIIIFWPLYFFILSLNIRNIILILILWVFLFVLYWFYWAVWFWKLCRHFSRPLNFVSKLLVPVFFLSLFICERLWLVL